MAYIPTWKQHAKGMSSTNLDTALKSAEAFEEEKNKELKASRQAREWEKSKKEYYRKQKPKWAKDRREAEIAPLKQAIKELKKGGEFDTELKPMPGFVLVQPNKQEKTEGGIILPDNEESLFKTNTGMVLAIGDEIVHLMKVVQPPVQVGDRVMFKKGLPGLEMVIQGEFCLLMQWSDLLGRIDA